MKTITKKAYAKVNLALDVLGRRENGYHDVRMIMQNLDIYDVLDFTLDERSSSSDRIVLTANVEGIPTDGRNLIYKAIDIMMKKFNLKGQVMVHLEKNIPVEAGMAGGSTDCAAALHAVNELYDLNLGVDELMDIGVTIGADVPYCVLAKTALSEGIGEILTPVSPLRDCFVLVAKPSIGVSTKMVYTNLKVNELESHPRVDDMILALEKNDIYKVAETMENVLETVTVNMYPELEAIKHTMKDNGALNSIMSGSGPTVFGLFDDEQKANKALEVLREKNMAKQLFVTVPV